MKIKSVIFTLYKSEKWLTSISEYDTETKKSTFINIPHHIACLISDFDRKTELKPGVYSYPLKSKENPYFQD